MKRVNRLFWGAPLALAATAVYALGFGDIELDSALNQPLRANVPLYAVKPAEKDGVTVRVASPDTFRRFGIARPNVLDDIIVDVQPASDPSRLNVVMRSSRAIREPFLTFLLEAEWPQGRALREYTVLLDPPVTPATVATRAPVAEPQPQPQVQPAAQTPPPAPVAQPAPPPVQSAVAQPQPVPAAPAPAPAAKPAPQPLPQPVASAQPAPQPAARPQPAAQPATQPVVRPEPAPVSAAPQRPASASPAQGLQPVADTAVTEGFAGKYGPVKAGETLSGIASQIRPAADITMNQLLLSLYRANPDAFDGNLNLLRRGAVLFVPDEQVFRSVDKTQATAEVKAQLRALRPSSQVAAANTAPADTGATDSAAESDAPASSARGGELKLAPAPEIMDSGDLAAGDDKPGESTTADAMPAEDEADSMADDGVATASGSADRMSEGMGDSQADTTQSDAMTADAGSMAGDEPTELREGNLLEPSELEELSGEDGMSGDEDAAGSMAADSDADEATIAAAPEGADAMIGDEDPVVTESDVTSFPWALLLILMALASFGIAIVLFLRNRSQYKPVDFSTVTPAATGGAAAALGSAYGHEDDDDADETTYTADSGAPTPDRALRQADGALAAGDWAAAAGFLRASLQAYPDDARLQRRLMEALHAGNARDEFIHEFDLRYADLPESDQDREAVVAMGRELAPNDARFDDNPVADLDMSEGGEDETVVLGDPEDSGDSADASDFDMTDFDDSADEEYRADVTDSAADTSQRPASNEGLDVSDFEIEDGDFDNASDDVTEVPKAPADADSSAEDDFDLGNESLDFEFTDSFEEEKPQVSEASESSDSDSDLAGGAAASGLSISEMDDLSFTDDAEADAADDEEDDISIKLDLARAYLDMGEPDMAVPLLEEVQSQGDDGQKQEAASLLDRAR